MIRRPGFFWWGVALATIGTVLHLPMYLGAADMGYRMAGMPMDGGMLWGMALIVVGMAAAAYGLMAGRPEDDRARVTVRALDDAPLRPAHAGLLLVMTLAITIDVMKPTTLAFVVPGMAREYDLLAPANPGGGIPAALLPLAGITGTVIGSFIWGALADRMGRRSAILLAGLLFVTTSVCGAMPSFSWNLAMCFVMGLGAGGLLPIAFTLLAETVPARHRGWILVLIGGDVAGAYIITSWLSAELIPTFSWRMMWLVGAPTGLLLILLNHWIPESPRFLMARGEGVAAAAIMKRYGAAAQPYEQETPGPEGRGRYADLFSRDVIGMTGSLVLLGLAVGLVTFGFQQWIPSNLQALGIAEADASRILRDAALIGFPFNFAAAWAYGTWGSRKSILLMSSLIGAALLIWFAVGDGMAGSPLGLRFMLIAPTWGISTLTAMLAAYGAEVYATRVRGRGAGLAAGATKFGGVGVIALVVIVPAASSIAGSAMLAAVPMVLAALVLLALGAETRRRTLEEISPVRSP